MADNSDSRKKTLVISMLAFLFIGGSVFLFFVIQGSKDLTSAGKKNNFTYGEAAREGASSFFKFIGFDDVESIAKGGTKERIREKAYKDAGLLDTSASAAADGAGGGEVPWSSPQSGRSASPTAVPRMEGGGTSGVGGIGGGGTKSSGGVSRFGEGSDSGNVKVSARAPEAGGKGEPANKNTLNALAKTRSMLGEGLRSGSAATAKSSWDASFGSGRAGPGAGHDLAYAKSGLVNLDKIKKGEVDNLKTTDPRSLSVPEVGAPKSAEGDGKKDGESKKSSAQEAIEKSMASSVLGAMGQGLGNAIGKGGTGDGNGSASLSEEQSSNSDFKSGNCTSQSQEGCSTATTLWLQGMDKSADYKEIAATGEGVIVQVNYKGDGPGVTTGMEGKNVSYVDSCQLLVKPGEPPQVSVMNCATPVETAK